MRTDELPFNPLILDRIEHVESHHAVRWTWVVSSTRPVSVLVDLCGPHQLTIPSKVEIASYTFAIGAFIHTW